jgi:zinc transporter 1/2/3
MAEEEAVCGSVDLSDTADYGMGLHIAAIFIIFAVSAAGTLLPLAAKRFQVSSDSVVMEALFAFSFGVVIATGLIHMINEGIERLGNECLGSVVEEYEALGPAFVLITLVVMHFIECESSVFFMGRAPALGHAHVHGHDHHEQDEESAAVVIATPEQQHPGTPTDVDYHAKNEDVIAAKHEDDTKRAIRRQIATAIFELGVIFHSIIIGLDLGVTGGDDFKTLLAAICFHQFFEGVAIGGSALKSIQSRSKLFLMNFAFAITTPIGLVIGIAIRTTYSSSSTTALWVEGILDCVAGGILLYTGLVELMTYNLTTNDKFLSRPTAQRLSIHLALWLGAGAMALIGKWA